MNCPYCGAKVELETDIAICRDCLYRICDNCIDSHGCTGKGDA
jgi:hypothetical protein